MACIALKRHLAHCGNYAKKDSYYCSSHSSLSASNLKDRWIRKYLIRGEFRYRGEWSIRVLLAPLKARVFSLDEKDTEYLKQDIRNLACIDVYLILLREGIFLPTHYNKYFDRALIFYLTLVVLGDKTHYLLKLFWKTFFNQSVLLYNATVLNLHILSSPLYASPADPADITYHPKVLDLFLNSLDTPVAQKWTWMFPRGVKSVRTLLQSYKTQVAEPLVHFTETVFNLKAYKVYEGAKKKQEKKISALMSELMEFCWHPDRIGKYMRIGYKMDSDMSDTWFK